ADAKRLFGVMGLAVKCGDTITVTIDGADEDAALSGIKTFCSSNF
ncbi:MAG: HPr family phosphocarrier protein, partial [Hydrogenoanaerobacterium sp.]